MKKLMVIEPIAYKLADPCLSHIVIVRRRDGWVIQRTSGILRHGGSFTQELNSRNQWERPPVMIAWPTDGELLFISPEEAASFIKVMAVKKPMNWTDRNWER